VSNVLAMGKEQLLDAVWPTYRVRVYVDSGKTFVANGKTNRVLVPMAPFGYHFSHDGLLYGFTKALAGTPGAVVQQLGADWFRIHVQSEGSARVRTQVTAVETLAGQGGEVCPHCPKCPPVDHGRCDCRLVGSGSGGEGYLAAAFGLALAAVLRRRRRGAA
jgi:MYXO-CTERM domain-containing protein